MGGLQVSVKVNDQEVQRTSWWEKMCDPVWDESFLVQIESMDDVVDLDLSGSHGHMRLGTIRELLGTHGEALQSPGRP